MTREEMAADVMHALCEFKVGDIVWIHTWTAVSGNKPSRGTIIRITHNWSEPVAEVKIEGAAHGAINTYGRYFDDIVADL